MLRAERRFSRGLKIRITVAGVSSCIAGFQEFCHARALTLTAHAEATLEGIEAGGSLDETTATVRPGEDTRDVLDKTVGLEVSVDGQTCQKTNLITADGGREDCEEGGDLGGVEDLLSDGHGGLNG